MKLYIAGGCKEHGRNSFLLQEGQESVLVDCGKLEGKSVLYPVLSKEQIQQIGYLFLTHSHADHVGAVEWLVQNGFTGTVVLSNATYEQMPYKPPKFYCLDNDKSEVILAEDLSVRYGKTGHCDGALWYDIMWRGKHVLFSGDYCESSKVYKCDLLRENSADMALIDCAYGHDEIGSKESRRMLIDAVKSYISKNKNVLLPVPKYGRGLDIIKDLLRESDIMLGVQKLFMEQLIAKNLLSDEELNRITEYNGRFLSGKRAYFICDPQLKQTDSRQLASKFLMQNDKIILTGSLDAGSYSETLYHSKAVDKIIYYVHQNLDEANELITQNHFKKVVLTHSRETFDTGEVPQNTIIAATGDEIIF